MARTTVTVNIHVNDDTEFQADKITDFVALKVGRDADLFIMNSEQAAKLADAAAEAFAILTRMEGYSSETSSMLAAGKVWISAIYGDQKITDFSATTRWTLDDWQVVMDRHGSFKPDQSDVDAFRERYKKGVK